MTTGPREYDDIEGTYVFDSRQARKGLALNMFCKSLDHASNRDVFAEDEPAYLEGFALTSEQRSAVLERDWLRLIELGGNIYYTFKLAIFDRRSMQYVGGAMSGVSEEEFRQMMLDGGRRNG